MIWFLISIAIILFWVFNMDHTKIASFKSHDKGSSLSGERPLKGERTLSRKERTHLRELALRRATSLGEQPLKKTSLRQQQGSSLSGERPLSKKAFTEMQKLTIVTVIAFVTLMLVGAYSGLKAQTKIIPTNDAFFTLIADDLLEEAVAKDRCDDFGRIHFHLSQERDKGYGIMKMLDHYSKYAGWEHAVRFVYMNEYYSPTELYLDTYDICEDPMQNAAGLPYYY